MHLMHSFLLLSVAARLALVGGLCVLLGALAWLGQVRRTRRKQIDAVGWVPWTGLSLLFCGAGLLLLLVGGQAWLRG